MVVEGMEKRRDAMIAALWANSNYDDDKGTRTEVIADIEANYAKAMAIVKAGKKPEATPEEEDELKSNPFFSKAMEGVRAMDAVIDDGPKKDNSEENEEEDQYKHMEVDQ